MNFTLPVFQIFQDFLIYKCRPKSVDVESCLLLRKIRIIHCQKGCLFFAKIRNDEIKDSIENSNVNDGAEEKEADPYSALKLRKKYNLPD